MMKTSLPVLTLALAWSQCLGVRDTQPLLRPRPRSQHTAECKEAEAGQRGTEVDDSKPVRKVTSGAKATAAH